jgi:hypothetical protein
VLLLERGRERGGERGRGRERGLKNRKEKDRKKV